VGDAPRLQIGRAPRQHTQGAKTSLDASPRGLDSAARPPSNGAMEGGSGECCPAGGYDVPEGCWGDGNRRETDCAVFLQAEAGRLGWSNQHSAPRPALELSGRRRCREGGVLSILAERP
jgi:hypothetical protein